MTREVWKNRPSQVDTHGATIAAASAVFVETHPQLINCGQSVCRVLGCLFGPDAVSG